MIHQLRIYEIFEPSKAAFHARFRGHAARLMRGHGFDIRAMWETTTDARTEFVYILAWPDESTMRARDRTRVVKGKSVSVRIVLGGRRHTKKKKHTQRQQT